MNPLARTGEGTRASSGDDEEERRITVGQALDGVFTVVYTMRGPATWLVTAWPANRKERAR